MNSNDTRNAEAISAAELAQEIERDPQFEAFLREAADIPVPEGLADRIMARHAITQRDEEADSTVVAIDSARKASTPEKRTPVPRWLAMAASVLLVVGLVGVSYLGRDPSNVIEQRIVVALNDTMPMYDKMVVNNEIDPNIQQNLHALMQTVGLKKVGEMGQINYCETKTINGSITGILVFPGKMGAVTVIYLMDKKVKDRRSIDSPSMEGMIWPESKGTVAIIGHKGETMIGDIEQRVRSSMQWF